ncbi:MAG TPA: response regulator [Leucothrix sp.]|nr:response regulator [Leucothrix sp.]
MYTLLLVEDDHAIREMLKMFLMTKKYTVLEAEDGATALQHLNQTNPDLLVLDWMLPDTDGLQLMQKIRETSVHKDLPILMLTARAEETDKIKGLDKGADDYMTKPVSLKELDARIRALIRRAQGLNQQKLLSLGNILLDPENKEVKIHGELIKISTMEYKLLYFFMKNPDRLYSRKQLLDSVWGQTAFIEERTVDVHIMRLRKTLKEHQIDKMLETVRGMGYRFHKE